MVILGMVYKFIIGFTTYRLYRKSCDYTTKHWGLFIRNKLESTDTNAISNPQDLGNRGSNNLLGALVVFPCKGSHEKENGAPKWLIYNGKPIYKGMI
jgi:hypothetical protein